MAAVCTRKPRARQVPAGDVTMLLTGGMMLIVPYPGPTTGGWPIYGKRFNMEERKTAAEKRTDL